MSAPGPAPRLMEIFSEAIELTSAEERTAYLDRVCGADRLLRGRVEGLLGAHVEADAFLESPAPAPTVDVTPGGRAASEAPGTTIGPYKLLEPIGEGGMGVVYVAEQNQPVRRRVALKIIKPGMDTKQVIARFEAERQALAMMDHPNIARVHDAGATESGRPYFVMELVRGIPITDYCDREQPLDRRAAGAVRPGLPGSAARPPEGDHPSRPEALEHPGDGHRRRARCPRSSTSASPRPPAGADRADALHRVRPVRRHAAVHEPRAGGPVGHGRRHPQRHLRLGVLLYELLTGTTPFDRETFRKGRSTRCAGSSARRSRRSRARGSAPSARRWRPSRPTARPTPATWTGPSAGSWTGS